MPLGMGTAGIGPLAPFMGLVIALRPVLFHLRRWMISSNREPHKRAVRLRCVRVAQGY